MKSLLVLLGLAVVVAVAQPPTRDRPECTEDSFRIARTCHISCLQRNRMTGCVVGCNQTCNTTMSRQTCPTLDRCTLGCQLRRDSDSGCPMCECEEPDDDMDDGQMLDPCRVNITTFFERSRCKLRCVVRRGEDDCFMCNRTCNETIPDIVSQCGVRDAASGRESQCPDGQVCILQGALNQCVQRPDNGGMCGREDPRDFDGDEDEDDDDYAEEQDDDDRDFFTRIEGAEDRLRVFSLQTSSEIEIPCAEGFRCSDQGSCTMIEGPCITRRQTDPEAQCSDDGNFEPRQCRRMNDGTQTCQCVFPRNGTMLPGTMRSGISDRDDAPDCDSRVFRRCYFQQRGRNFTVRHDETFLNSSMCRRCRCNDGQGEDCEADPSVDCSTINPGTTPRDCTRGDTTVEHGTRRMIGKCNMCGCNNGRLTCTDIDECKDRSEDRDDAEQRCDRCQDAPARLVCGRDGRTFRSRCVAMNCSGLGENDILDGPCSSQAVCSLYPCRDGYICIPLGGRSCLRNEGCRADERRTCVDRDQLRCRVSNVTRDGFNVDDVDSVCGSDRRTYRSFCHLIQQAPANTRVAHAGPCEMEECNSGQVCGSDGVTYNSTCHLRTQSANAQVDYRGECVDGGEKGPGETCRFVRDDEKRCEIDRENCERRVLSSDGCCPICGGITTLAIDRDALDEYSRATDSDANLDEFMTRMTRDDVIPYEVRERCTVEVTHVRNSTQTNIEVKMMAQDRRADAEFCHMSSMQFADKINSADSEEVTTELPAEASFASAAVAAPQVVDEQSGAPSLLASCLGVLAVALMAAAI